MIVLLVLGLSILIFRALGAFGIDNFESWAVSTRFGLSVMFFFTATAHFTSMKEDLVRMMPEWVRHPRTMVYFTGICEILGAIGLLISPVRVPAAIALIVFLIAVLPANINAAKTGATLRGKPATALWLRIPMQILFIALILWSAILSA